MAAKALQILLSTKIDDLKGQDIIALDVQGKSSITDCMIICTGTSSRHVMPGRRPRGAAVVARGRYAVVGAPKARMADWIVVDLGDVIVHAQVQEESRRLYELKNPGVNA